MDNCSGDTMKRRASPDPCLRASCCSALPRRCSCRGHARSVQDPSLGVSGGYSPVARWVFRNADLMSCPTPAYTLRHLRSYFGHSLKLVALGIGVDEPSARAFLLTQRLK